ncbi:hypothetical protein BpHYR1_005486 [Brachionus plicatilis]|uniref:Uncharacterized protein n=1 Tax=Brachionus plicatilis TaxID=10195 RepID=A0A3M7PFA7_BRAPC|nr:hypothetical protein BpHYR1_005486 [Brachionus plicatilis]
MDFGTEFRHCSRFSASPGCRSSIGVEFIGKKWRQISENNLPKCLTAEVGTFFVAMLDTESKESIFCAESKMRKNAEKHVEQTRTVYSWLGLGSRTDRLGKFELLMVDAGSRGFRSNVCFRSRIAAIRS